MVLPSLLIRRGHVCRELSVRSDRDEPVCVSQMPTLVIAVGGRLQPRAVEERKPGRALDIGIGQGLNSGRAA